MASHRQLASVLAPPCARPPHSVLRRRVAPAQGAGPLVGPGVLHLRVPAAATAIKIRQWLEVQRQPCVRQAECFSIAVNAADPAQFIGALRGMLTATEQADTRALFQPTGRELTLSDYFAMQSLDGLLARQDGVWLMSLLARQGLAMHFQPIVAAADRGLFAYECLMRGDEAGALIPPSRMLEVARKAELSHRLDAAARQAAFQATARHHIRAKVFVNFSAAAIYDPLVCLANTVELIGDLGLSRDQFVFEAVESDGGEDLGHLRTLLECFRRAGFAVALDDLTAGYDSLRRLEALTPDYIKLDMEIISGVDRDPYKALAAARLLETARQLGIRSIAEGVETAAEFAWARDHGADFVQGFYVAQPASPPPALAVAHA
ncbi:MAG: EAL domain-containing protein [Terriglobales bacterium]